MSLTKPILFSIFLGIATTQMIIPMKSYGDAVCLTGSYVSAGTSADLGRFREPYRYTLPPGKSPSDIVGMAVDGENNYNFVWFRDGTVSAGTSADLDRFREPYRYNLPGPNIKTSDIVGMAIDGENNYNFVWFVGGDSKIC
ncbi:MAG: hypothetical protein AB4040_15110 [Synechococcus sp.]